MKGKRIKSRANSVARREAAAAVVLSLVAQRMGS
jgi:hypothetical protein